MKTIVLHGFLGRMFGKSFQVAVNSPVEAMRLLECNFPGRFREAITNQHIRIWTDSPKNPMSEDQLSMWTGSSCIHFQPIIAGRAKGLLGSFFGFPLLGSVFGGGLGAGGLFGLGAGVGAGGGLGSILMGVTLIGVSSLIGGLVRQDSTNNRSAPDEKRSFLFDGPVNTTVQGGPVPLVYGRVRTGSVLISGGLTIEDI